MTSESKCSRNYRERNRVRKISSTFLELKNKLPEEWTTTKMSRVDILKKTSTYIRHLMQILHENESQRSKPDIAVTYDQKKTTEGNWRQDTGKNGSLNALHDGNSGVHVENEMLFQWIDDLCTS